MRRVHAARLKAELRSLLPWSESEYERLLLSDYLPAVADEPVVSVIVPVYGELDHTLRCLVSIGATDEKTPYEIIVVDDCSRDATEATLSGCHGIRYLRSDENGGFITSCNMGAAAARGRYLHFLNNDTTVLPGWLDRLVETIESVPRAGLVGSRLIYPDLRLQEAGGVVWRDASASNVGNRGDPWNPHYCALRDVDFCSGASILVSKELFDGVGGFDVRYRPAYYEDTDLAFEVREHGKRVLFQPASRVIHFEGGTAGTNVERGVKKHQVINRRTFREKWSRVLDDHGEHGDISTTELDRFSSGSVLVLAERTPAPDKDGGSVEIANMLRAFRALGVRVTFLPVFPLPRFLPLPDVRSFGGVYTEALQQIGVECPYFPYEPSVGRFLRERGREFDAVVLTRARIADRYLSTVRRRCPRAKVVFNTVDLQHVREEREARHSNSALMRLMAADTKRRELSTIERSDATLVVSTAEAALLSKVKPAARVKVIPINRKIHGRSRPAEGRKDVLFVGGFRHRPNIDAVKYLVDSIWPHVRRDTPGVRLHVVGSSTPKEIFALACDDIEVHGHVQDLGPIYDEIRLTVAPVRFGAGVKTKVIESLGFGVPCVTTTMGVEGSALRDGEEILVADDPDDFARAVSNAYTDDVLWEKLSTAGLAHVLRTHSREANQVLFEELLDELGVPHR